MQTLINLGAFVPKIPPSELGFVCKPELPPHINILFRARPPLEYIKLNHKEIRRNYTGIFDSGKNDNIMDRFEKKNDKTKIEKSNPKYINNLIELIKRLEKEKEINKEKLKNWDPKNDLNATTNPYKTLFVYKLKKDVDVKKLEDIFVGFGPIKQIRLIKNKLGISKGYGFIEFEHTRHFKEALRQGNRIKISGSYINVDRERGRTDSKFKPRKYGGGKGRGRHFPRWLENELDEVREKYGDLINKNEKETETETEKELEKEKVNEKIEFFDDDNIEDKNKNIINNFKPKNSVKINGKIISIDKKQNFVGKNISFNGFFTVQDKKEEDEDHILNIVNNNNNNNNELELGEIKESDKGILKEKRKRNSSNKYKHGSRSDSYRDSYDYDSRDDNSESDWSERSLDSYHSYKNSKNHRNHKNHYNYSSYKKAEKESSEEGEIG